METREASKRFGGKIYKRIVVCDAREVKNRVDPIPRERNCGGSNQSDEQKLRLWKRR